MNEFQLLNLLLKNKMPPTNFSFNETNITRNNNKNKIGVAEDDDDYSGFPYDLLLLIVPIGILLLMFLYMGIKECLWSCKQDRVLGRRNRSNSGSSISLNSTMSIDTLQLEKQFNSFKIIITDLEELKKEDNDTCTICLEDQDGDDNKMVKLSCNHVFHQKCIEDWVKVQHNTGLVPQCAICREKIDYSTAIF